ncbi:MAG TPA: DUF4124 domain-containing protein [Methylotenera sp.]|nr:DUF4124 domain-containing protein [Methylotenera sp.]
MNLRILLLCAIILPTLANAEIYKWKDKEGKVRYTDVPPPSNIKQESLYGKKIPKPTTQAPLRVVEKDAASIANIQKQKDKEKAAIENPGVNPAMSKEEAAAKRAKEADAAKAEDEAKKVKEENCKAAKANLKTHMVGGRLLKTNEKGEREYMSDADIKNGIATAQADVDKYCDQ